MPADLRPTIAVIGGGPRGISILERIGARLADPPGRPSPELGGRATPVDGISAGDVPALAIHIIDDTEPGAGRIWRTDQTREMCKNTLADAVTLFTDESVEMSGPVRPGPTLFEWCVLALHRADPSGTTTDRVAGLDPRHVRLFDATPVRTGLVDDYRAELAALAPDSHPSRALYGEYLRWCLASALAALPDTVAVTVHRARAVGIERTGGRDRVLLDGGRTIAADAAVAATGWLPRRHTPAERTLARVLEYHPDLVWVEPDSPIDQPLSRVPDGAHTIVRGLGMGFFDAMALLTIERGGKFVEDADAVGGLRYDPSGREPVMHATSRRGLPFRAKTQYGSLPPRAPQRHLRSVDWARVPRPIDFDTVVWPLVVKDAFADYVDVLVRVRPEAVHGSVAAVQEAITRSEGTIAAVSDAVAAYIPEPTDRFDLAAALAPVREARDPEEFSRLVVAYLAHDLAEAQIGRDSAFKAGLWSISSARQVASTIGAFGGFDAESREQGFRMLHSVGGMIGSGPPAFRNRQLLALVEAGVVRFLGPDATVAVEQGRFLARSSAVPGSEVRASALVDAWVHPHDVQESADPLVVSLIAGRRARAFCVPMRHGGDAMVTGGIDIDPATGRLIHPDGTLDERVHVAGIPTEQTQHDTLISPMPGSNASMLRETDRVAGSLLDTIMRGAKRP